ncbi:hypothetical protein V493_06765 [Pseudogymnoascus sp. VKM F-4281 (FW-2241)]|nr:hypothetical protein V493_06765 [Pseudogymnoascus sp. VKM F-4281 (FW-2241)]
MAFISNGYASRVLSTRPSNEYQEGPEVETWSREYNVPFNTKRPGSQILDIQGYPVKRPRNSLEASHSHPYGRQEEIHAGTNKNINPHSPLDSPSLANLQREQAQHRPTNPQLNIVPSVSHHQSGTQPNSVEYHSRITLTSESASQRQGNYTSSYQSTPQRNYASPSRSSPYAIPDYRQSGGRESLSNTFHPQNSSRQPFQPQISRGSRASSVAALQEHTGNQNDMKFTTSRYQSVPLPAAHQRSGQYAVSGVGTSGQSSQYPSQGIQRTPQGLQPSSQRFQHSPQGFQPSPIQSHPDATQKSVIQSRSETSFANEVNNRKLPVVKRTGPFIIDDDEDETGYPESFIINETKIDTATASQLPVPKINFAQGRRGIHPLTSGLDDPPQRKNDAINGFRKSKSGVKWPKKVQDAAIGKIQKQAEAYAKIKEKEDMAAKTNDTNALFEEPINEAAQARIQTSIQKEEMHKREVEARRRCRQGLDEELEMEKKESAEREYTQKEVERAERELRKSKTQEERVAIQRMREEEDKKRHEEKKRKAEEVLRRKREEKSEREAAAIEKEAAAECKRQQDAENLKKTLEASRLAATSLRTAKKGQVGRGECGGRATATAIKTPASPVDDGGLFVPEQVVFDPSDETEPTHRSVVGHPGTHIQHTPLTPTSPPKTIPNIKTLAPNTEQKASNIAATIKEIPGSQDISLRALAGWRGARIANTETKVSSIIIEHHKEKLSADQKMRDEASAQERARERAELQGDFAVLFEKLSATLMGQVQGEIKGAVDKVLNARPPTIPTNARDGSNTMRGIPISPKKFSSETQCFLGHKTSKKSKELAPSGEKTPSDSDARRREKEETRLVEKAKKRFEVKLQRDNAEQSRYMSEYEFKSLIERQQEYVAKRHKKHEKEKRMMPSSEVRFGYEDIDVNEVNSSRPNNSKSDKGRCGGIMARLRKSNGSLSQFQEAADAKIVDDKINYPWDDADSESEVSEEDPDDDESDTTPIDKPDLAAYPDSRGRASNITATAAVGRAVNSQSVAFDSKATVPTKPRHLQDKEMVYIYSVQRSEIRDQETSLPITIKQFFDRDDANEFAEEELRRTRWGPSMPKPQISQYYSKETGLFNGRAAIDSEEDIIECVDVVAQAQYIGDLDDFEHEKVKVVFKPKVYFIFKSITKKVQTLMGSYDDEASEGEETEQNMEIDRNEEAEHTVEIDQSDEAEHTMETDQSGATKQITHMDQDDNETPVDRKTESPGDAIDALFEEEEEGEVEPSDNSGHNLAANVHQLSLDSTAPPETKEITLTQTSKPLEVYTDRELANKRASEIFLAAIRPVGGDISQLVAFQNDAVKPVRESLEDYNKSGELFLASNDYANNGEVRVWVEDFEIKGPLN